MSAVGDAIRAIDLDAPPAPTRGAESRQRMRDGRRRAAERREWCDDCGCPHTLERRLAALRRMLPATSAEVGDAWPHLWERDRAGHLPRLLFADLHRLGAVRDAAGEWRSSGGTRKERRPQSAASSTGGLRAIL